MGSKTTPAYNFNPQPPRIPQKDNNNHIKTLLIILIVLMIIIIIGLILVLTKGNDNNSPTPTPTDTVVVNEVVEPVTPVAEQKSSQNDFSSPALRFAQAHGAVEKIECAISYDGENSGTRMVFNFDRDGKVTSVYMRPASDSKELKCSLSISSDGVPTSFSYNSKIRGTYPNVHKYTLTTNSSGELTACSIKSDVLESHSQSKYTFSNFTDGYPASAYFNVDETDEGLFAKGGGNLIVARDSQTDEKGNWIYMSLSGNLSLTTGDQVDGTSSKETRKRGVGISRKITYYAD